MTGNYRGTLMRLGVKSGTGCARLLEDQTRGLDCRAIQTEKIWGVVEKKQKRTTSEDRRAGLDDTPTFVAIDAESKMVPAFHVGLRDHYHATAFVRIWPQPRHPAPANHDGRPFGLRGRGGAELRMSCRQRAARKNLRGIRASGSAQAQPRHVDLNQKVDRERPARRDAGVYVLR